ncbi:hypothetical protein ACIQZG_22590 [Lysinibacillus sp. NPDC096418]|uniref:hypothetical protein n=1 Tax=Lysinibacillus sp. NPDC096418 TaxID=3364138 RepID=UPI00380901F1
MKEVSTDLYQQKENILLKEWLFDFDENNTTNIERQGKCIEVPINEIQKGDILLDYLTAEMNINEGSKINLLNLAVNYPGTSFVKIGEVISSEKESMDMYIQKIKVKYQDYLSEFKIDKNLVQNENETFSLKDMYYSSEIQNKTNKVINKAIRTGGELDKIIKKILVQNQLEPKEVYKVKDMITADGEGLNNKILYLENKEGTIKSYNIGNPINGIKYIKGEQIQLENVLRNSISLLEKACKNIEKKMARQLER